LTTYGRQIFFVRIGDAKGGGGTRTTGVVKIADNATTTVTFEPNAANSFFDCPAVPFVNPPYAPQTACSASETSIAIDTTVFLGYAPQNAYWAFKVTGVYEDGTETLPTPISNVVLLSGDYQTLLTAIPVFPTQNTVPCVFRKIYGSIFTPYNPLTAGVPTFGAGVTQVCAVIPDNTSTTLTFQAGASLVGGDVDPKLPPGCPPGTSSVGSQIDGPWLEDDVKPDDIDDSNMDLLLNPPVHLTIDNSQVRNRIFVLGKGVQLTADAPTGQSFISVSDVTPFSPNGGYFIVGTFVIAYKSLTATKGAANIALGTALTHPITQSDWRYGGGSPVRPFVQVDDVGSQRKLGILELDANGNTTSGVHEYTIQDDTLTSTDQCIARGLAELRMFANPISKVSYSCRDPKNKVGKIVHFNLSNPPISGDFIIQNVDVDQFHDESDQLSPRYNVQADSAARFDFDDFLLYLDKRVSQFGASLAGVVDTAIAQGSGAVTVTTRRVYFTEWASLNFSSSAAPSAYNQGWSVGRVSQAGAPEQGVSDQYGYWSRVSSKGNATEGSWQTPNNVPFAYAEELPLIRWRMRTGPAYGTVGYLPLANKDIRLYCIITDSTIPTIPFSTDQKARKAFGLRFTEDDAGSPAWWIWWADGTRQQIVTAATPLEANTIYTIEFKVVRADFGSVVTPHFQVTINGSVKGTFVGPGWPASTPLLAELDIFGLTNDVRSIDLSAVYGEAN
jgi:hypothetical protein